MQLVINTFGATLRRQGERFIVKAGAHELGVSAHKVQSIWITTGVLLSSDTLELAQQHNIDVVFLDRAGTPFGRFWQGRMGSTAAIRRRQLEVADGIEGLALARDWVAAKVRHQREFLQDLERRRPGQADFFRAPLAALDDCQAKLQALAGTLDDQRATIMGLEGSAGRTYFACLALLLPETYRFEGRSRQPAKDGFNGMLNYSYGVLYSLVERACILAGLDPFVGFLHTDNYAKRSLVFDLIEPFRILGERATVLLFTGRRVGSGWFEPVPGGVALSKEGRAAFLASFNERLDKGVRYPMQGRLGKTRNIKQRDVIRHEAHALANALLGKRDLPRVIETRALWDEANQVAAPETEPDVEDQATEDPPC
jgi:CRISPR-associated protein Cas1